MNTLDKQYTDLLQDILENGITKQDRTGTGTVSVFGRQIRHKMSEGFPLLTTKKMAWKTMVVELLWFLKGDTNIKFLVDNGSNIWNGDCFSNYLKNRDSFSNKDNVKEDVIVNGINGSSNRAYTMEEFINKIKTDDEFAKKWGELGSIYGKQWRSWKHMGPKSQKEMLDENTNWPWKTTEIDQIKNLINDLKTNPDSRRLMVSAWNPADLDSCVLPPCHYGFQVYTRELSNEEIAFEANKRGFNLKGMTFSGKLIIDSKEVKEKNIPTRAISLMFNMRSNDVPLGLPFNIASYGLLLEIIGKMVNMVPDELIANLGDAHIYLNQIDGVKEQIGRELSLEERRKMITQEMFNQIYTAGDSSTLSHSEIDQWGIPRMEPREPYPLPTLKHMKTEEFYKSLSENVSLFGHLDAKDFQIEDYQSHPTIRMPLSN